MHDLPFSDDFKQFAAQPDSAVSGGLLVARVINKNVDLDFCRAELARLASALGTLNEARELFDFLREQGFRGAETYYTPDNSSLEHVLRTRRGIPISLALVVLGVAEQLGLAAGGINFPGHFLVSVDGVLADPFRMQVIEAAERQAVLQQLELPDSEAFPPAGPVDIVLRMLNNLRALALERDDHAGALDYSAYQLLLAADRVPIHLARAQSWLAAGAPDMARHELDLALTQTDDETLKQQIVAHRAQLEGTPSKLH